VQFQPNEEAKVMNENAAHPGGSDENPGLNPQEAEAEERTSANEELNEAFGDTEAHETRLEEVAEDSGEDVEEHDDDREITAEDKVNDIQDDGVIFHGGG
jgi:hypothetical protein